MDPDLSRQDRILKEPEQIIATHHPGCQRTRPLANPLLAPYDVAKGRPRALEDLDGPTGKPCQGVFRRVPPDFQQDPTPHAGRRCEI